MEIGVGLLCYSWVLYECFDSTIILNGMIYFSIDMIVNFSKSFFFAR